MKLESSLLSDVASSEPSPHKAWIRLNHRTIKDGFARFWWHRIVFDRAAVVIPPSKCLFYNSPFWKYLEFKALTGRLDRRFYPNLGD